MDFISILFILLSVLVLGYVAMTFKTTRRLPILLELFLGVYAFVFMIFLFPGVLNALEVLLGISSAINFIVYTSIFVAYFMLFILYQKDEKQRVDISKLNREIALLRKELKDKKK